MTCDRCYRLTTEGEHGLGLCPLEPRRANAAIGDDIPGGIWIENLGHEPVKFYSKQAILDEADRRGLQRIDRWAGPTDRHLTNWAAGMDAQTLANAAALVARQGHAPSDPTDTGQYPVIERTVTDSEFFTVRVQ